MTYSQIKALIANPGEKLGWSHRYMVYNECGPLAIVYANNEQDALDEAVDCDKLDCQLMTDEDHKEYSDNGWDDSFCYLGNASEPFWTEYLGIKEL